MCSSAVTRQTLLEFIGARPRGLPRHLVQYLAWSRQATGDDAQDDSRGRRRPRGPQPDDYPKIPSDAGTELMNSGIFGISDTYQSSRIARKHKIGSRLLYRELGSNHLGRGKATNRLIAQVLCAYTADEGKHVLIFPSL